MRHWRLVAAAAWLAVAGLVFARGSRYGAVATWAAVAFAVWNLARWYHDRTRRPATRTDRLPLQPNRDAARADEYNPEFDFERQQREPHDERR